MRVIFNDFLFCMAVSDLLLKNIRIRIIRIYVIRIGVGRPQVNTSVCVLRNHDYYPTLLATSWSV